MDNYHRLIRIYHSVYILNDTIVHFLPVFKGKGDYQLICIPIVMRNTILLSQESAWGRETSPKDGKVVILEENKDKNVHRFWRERYKERQKAFHEKCDRKSMTLP